MVTVNDVTQMMFRWAPPELAMDWDNVGLLVGRGDREVHRVLVALDVSPDVAAEAAETGADLIVSHHPVMNIRWHAQQMQTLREDTRLGGLLTELVKRDISAICMHTALRRIQIGVHTYDGVGEAGYLRHMYAHQSGCGGGRCQRLSDLHAGSAGYKTAE